MYDGLFMCMLLIYTIGRTSGCTLNEAYEYSLGIYDVSILIAGGCDSFFSSRISQECCDTTAKLLGDPCAEPVLYSIDDSFFLIDLSLALSEKCRVEPSVGYVLNGCPDGVVTGEEQCDDGNAISGDGCSSYCFVEDGFDCFPDKNGTSVCWQCEEECFLQNRQACVSPGGSCGDCLEEFEENDMGYCAARKHVYYGAVTAYESSQAVCEFRDVGYALEGSPVKSSDAYLDLIRMWEPNRTFLANDVTCSLMDALQSTPSGRNVVVVLETFVPTILGEDLVIGLTGDVEVVLFSDAIRYPRLLSRHVTMFRVQAYSGLHIRGFEVSGCTSDYGAFFESSGIVVVEDSTISDCFGGSQTTSKVSSTLPLGLLVQSMGYTHFDNVTFSNHTTRVTDDVGMEVDDPSPLFVFNGQVHLSNVSFLDTYAGGVLINFEFMDTSSYVRDLYFNSVTAGSSLINVETNAVFEGLYISNCVSSDGLVNLSQTSEIVHFEFSNNTIKDDYGVVLNLGKAALRNGAISGTSALAGLGKGGAIMNRGDLYMENVLLESNRVGALTSTHSAHIYMSEFNANVADPQLYSAVYNKAEMVIDRCSFFSLPETQSIVSEIPIILRNSILPENDMVSYLRCEETLALPDGSARRPCGFNTFCSDSAYSGVNCTCAPGHLGSPLVMCGPPAAVHVLPDPSVVAFVTKDDSGEETTKLLGLLSDGIGMVTWQVVEETLPQWLSFSPQNGSFIKHDPCLSDMIDLYLTFQSGDIRGNDTYHTGDVLLHTLSLYEENTKEDYISLSVQMIVEVLASPSQSHVSQISPCYSTGGDGICEVEAGSTVSVVVDLLDSSGHSLGVGGTGFGVDPAPLASIDYENGTHVVTFEAPQTHFDITVTLVGEHVRGSPLSFRVFCSGARDWDKARGECVSRDVEIPKEVIGLGAVLAFVCASVMVTLMQRKNKSFQLSFFHNEATITLWWIVVDLVDIGTDVGAYWSVSMTESLSSYAPWYLVAVCVAVLFSLFSLHIRFRTIMLIIRESATKLPCTEQFAHPLPVEGVFGLTHIKDFEDFTLAICRLQRKFRAHVLSLIGLFVEDVPMQILNTIILCSSRSDYPVEVLVSTEVTCILIGMKLSKIARARQIRENIRRITLKVQKRRMVETKPFERRKGEKYRPST
eukprot:Rmarinus@m.11405